MTPQWLLRKALFSQIHVFMCEFKNLGAWICGWEKTSLIPMSTCGGTCCEFFPGSKHRSLPPPPRVRPPGGVSHNPLKLPVAEGPGSIATCTCASCLRPPFRYTAQLATSHGGSPSHPLRPRPQLRAHCHFPPQGEPL